MRRSASHYQWPGRALLLLALLTQLVVPRTQPARGSSPTLPSTVDAWWDEGWPYRLRATTGGSGTARAQVDFTQVFDGLGLNHALLDLRSIRVVPYFGGAPSDPIPYAESYSRMLHDGETTTGWSVNDDGFVMLDGSRHTQGAASVRVTITNTVGGYGYPGAELHPTTVTNWRPYETLLYEVWPEVNGSARDQAPDLYWFKVYNACAGNSVTQGGPPLALDRWNQASVSLSPLDSCWPANGLNLASITRIEFHTRDNDTVNGRSGLWDDGDVLTLWFDNLRLVNQDSGAIRWHTLAGVTTYYIYFDILAHEGHPPPVLDPGLASGTLASVGQPEAGGYYHQVAGTSGAADTALWTAPSVEKVLPTMAPPVVSAPLRIQAARGEFEPFQVIVRSPTQRRLAVSATSFAMGAERIPAPSIHRVDMVTISSAGDHWDRMGPWPDPLWPLDLGSMVTFPAGQNQALWFTVHVPWDAAAGLYQATVTIASAAVPVELEVWDFALPRDIHLVSEWGFGWSSIVEDIYQGYGDWDCYWEMVEAFKQDFADHRLIPKGVAWPAGLNYPGGVEYDCNGGLDPDAWGDWDFATIGGRYIHGDGGFNAGYGFPAFLSHGPASNTPAESLPYSFCGIARTGVLGSAAYQAKWRQYLSAVDAYLVSDDYQMAYYHIVNEPQTWADYTIVGQISALTESAAPHLRQLLSEQVEPAIYNYPGAKIDIWMPTISNYEPIKSQQRQANHDEEVWWYFLYGDDPPLPNPILMSHPGIEARMVPWLAWAERVDGLLHYSVTDWSPNPWQNPNVTGRDNGDGFFFYPPRTNGAPLDSCGQNGNRLVPSLRWEHLRDGMEDYEYLWLLAGDKPLANVVNPADDYVAQLVSSRTLFSHVPTDLAATRAALARVLQGPQAIKIVRPVAVGPGGTLTYTLVYTHSGVAASLLVTDLVPAATPVLDAIGPGTVTVDGRLVTWQVPVVALEPVTLTIRAAAGPSPRPVVNRATFSSTVVLERQAGLLIYLDQSFVPLMRR